ncbi:cupin domain-containing protein [Acetobacterium paludosum]|uniref:Cupin domain-containing protein n=1 Tax=Acetobacterium paludosum TaxID=52693 RepID=A0A923HS24_9FIRM|nr:cupin domain-containing protein [Acetobacterium paludosum]MBC3887669.1 cupin domain-containing protein [Acetobacterium paludosum]
MIVNKNAREIEVKKNMRDGKGEIEITHVLKNENLGKNARLYAEIIIKPGDSIGNHQHIDEKEIFYFLSGSGIVTDNEEQIKVVPGDVMVTPDKSFHSVINNGTENLVFMALILHD